MFRTLLVLTLLSFVAPQAARAQQDTTGLVPGRRIRIHQEGNQKLVGSFVAMDSASLAMVTTAGDTVRVPRSNVTGLDLSQGTKSNAGKGAITGLLIGGGVGIVLGLAASSDAEGSFFDVGAGTWAAGSGLFFGAVGAGIGALIGSGSRSDKWAPTAWPTLSFLPSGRDGKTVALGMHLTF
jgi:hypothetical protein